MFQDRDDKERHAKHLAGFFDRRCQDVKDVFFSECIDERASDELHPQCTSDEQTAGSDEAVSRAMIQVQYELKKRKTNGSDEEHSGDYPREEEDSACSEVCLQWQDQAFVEAGCFIQ